MKSYAAIYKHATTKADADGKYIDSVSGKSVKALKEEFERTKLAGAPIGVQKAAEDAYKDAQARYLTDVISDTLHGTSNYAAKAGGATTGDGRQFDIVAADIRESEIIRGSYEDTLGDTAITSAGDFKTRHFAASDREYAIDHDPRHSGHKADDSAAGVGGKK